MDVDERKWIEEALSMCETATRKSALILLIRHQDRNDEADIVVTNAKAAAEITALREALGEDASDE